MESEFNLTETLKEVVAQESLKAQAKGLRLVADLDHHLPALALGDGVRLRQVLKYLISNAIKFTAQGEVEMTVTASPAVAGRCLLAVTVRDTGIGMAPEQLRMAFRPFWQVESGLARQHLGLGLGLAVVNELLRLMQGEITVASEPGKGSVLSFRVPLRIPGESPARLPPPRPPEPPGRTAFCWSRTTRLLSKSLRIPSFAVPTSSTGSPPARRPWKRPAELATT